MRIALGMARKKTYGGPRLGAGRKQRGTEPRQRRNLTLTDSEMHRASELGEGNVSLGISRALLTCPDWARKVE